MSMRKRVSFSLGGLALLYAVTQAPYLADELLVGKRSVGGESLPAPWVWHRSWNLLKEEHFIQFRPRIGYGKEYILDHVIQKYFSVYSKHFEDKGADGSVDKISKCLGLHFFRSTAYAFCMDEKRETGDKKKFTEADTFLQRLNDKYLK